MQLPAFEYPGVGRLLEVPRSEVSALMQQLGGSGSALHRAALNAYGPTRLTDVTASYLHECGRYEWSTRD